MKKDTLLQDFVSGKFSIFEFAFANNRIMKVHALKPLLSLTLFCFCAMAHAQHSPIIRMKTGNIPTTGQAVIPAIEKQSEFYTAFVTFSAMPDALQK